MPFLALVAVVEVLGFAAVIAGSVADWNCKHGKCKRDVSTALLNQTVSADVGPCNIPMYNFDMCRDQVKSQNIIITSSIPSPGGKLSRIFAEARVTVRY
jgi:hypothetical protein